MKSNKYFVLYLIMFFLSACNPSSQESLLTDEVCSENCGSSVLFEPEGEPEISASSNEMTLHVDQGDVLEISGTCSDLGRVKNKIYVQLFETNNDSTIPILDNSVNNNCNNSTTDGTGGSINLNGQNCLFVTSGLGQLTEDGQLYPQCFNGKFSFSVVLGKITTDKMYLAKIKLSTFKAADSSTTGSVSGQWIDTSWQNIVINRSVSVPPLSIVSDTNLNQCKVSVLASPIPFWSSTAFGAIEYTLSMSMSSANMAAKPHVAGQGDAPPSAANSNVYTNQKSLIASEYPLNPATAGLIEGVTYGFKVTAKSINYGQTDRSTEDQSEVKCVMPAPVLKSTGYSSGKYCGFEVSATQGNSTYQLEVLNSAGGVVLTGSTSTAICSASFAANPANAANPCTVLNGSFNVRIRAASAANVRNQSITGDWSALAPCILGN